MTARGLAPLRHRGFRLLVSGQLASNVGDAFYAVALPWYVLAEHGGPLLLGTVLAAYGIPRTVLLAVGGHASDRWGPWTVMMTSDGVRAFAAAALAVAAASGPARAAVLVPIAAVLGAGEGLFLPGSFAIVPALLPMRSCRAATRWHRAPRSSRPWPGRPSAVPWSPCSAPRRPSRSTQPRS